jgi:hypothetical protein
MKSLEHDVERADNEAGEQGGELDGKNLKQNGKLKDEKQNV